MAADLLHIASHQINVGDGAVTAGLRARLRHCVGQLEIEEQDIVDFDSAFGGVDIGAIRFGDYRLTLVGGGGAIDGKDTRNHSGFALPLTPQALRGLPRPIAFVALGHNLFSGEPMHHHSRLAEFVRTCAELDIPFSVRNDGSLERLRRAIGTDAAAVSEVPDPGFFLPVDPTYCIPQLDGQRRCVLIQLAGDNLARRLAWRGPHAAPVATVGRLPELRRAFLIEIGELIVWLATRYDAQVVLAPHITRDLALAAELLDLLPVRVARKHTRVLGVAHPRRAAQFFAAYAAADLVLGMRGHSVICAVGLRRPCVALSTHAKVEGFMHKCGLDRWVVRPGAQMLERLAVRLAAALEDPREYLLARDLGTRDFEARMDAFIRRCWAKVAVQGDYSAGGRRMTSVPAPSSRSTSASSSSAAS